MLVVTVELPIGCALDAPADVVLNPKLETVTVGMEQVAEPVTCVQTSVCASVWAVAEVWSFVAVYSAAARVADWSLIQLE